MKREKTTLPEMVRGVKSFAKKQALTFLPDWVLTPLKKRHYLKVLQNLSEEYDPDFFVLKHLVKPGDYVIDLGAHVGAVTKFLSDLVGPEGCVYSVEPFPLNFDILKLNVRKLQLTNVELINCAVSDERGKFTMEIPTFKDVGESFYDARLIPSGATSSLRHAEVDVQTVDSLFADLARPVSFVKCDVEGQELQTLRGSKTLIEKDKPAWLLEISLMKPNTHDEVRQLLGGYGYQEFWFENERLRPWTRGDKPIDVFFLQPRQLEKTKKAGLLFAGSSA